MASEKNLVNRLADAGEEAIQRLSGAPGGERLVSMVNMLRERTDEMQRRLRGMDEIEKRLRRVEERLDKVEAGGSPAEGRASAGSASSSSSSRPKKSTDPSN